MITSEIVLKKIQELYKKVSKNDCIDINEITKELKVEKSVLMPFLKNLATDGFIEKFSTETCIYLSDKVKNNG